MEYKAQHKFTTVHWLSM